MAACNGFEGVAAGYLNSLAGTVTGANTVAINTGGALVDGKYYNNSASVNVNIPSAVGGGNTRIDRIVLRCSWAGYTVRITRIAGTDAASPTVPAIVQTPGTTYDIKLYQALVSTAGAVTLTDERVMAPNCGVVARQGGSATDWGWLGTTSYIPTGVKIQCGSQLTTGAGTVVITFPVAFSYPPIVMVTPLEDVYAYIYNKDANSVSIHIKTNSGADGPPSVVYWLAIGPA